MTYNYKDKQKIKIEIINILIFSLLTFFTPILLPAQNSWYDESLTFLKGEGQKIIGSQDAEERAAANQKFKAELQNLLEDRKSYALTFDSISNLSVLSPPHQRFRIFNWMLPKKWGEMEFFGIIQFAPQNGSGKCRIIELHDKSQETEGAEFKQFNNFNWFGALYYEMIPQETDEETIYTLLGWNGNNNTSNKKVIEIMHIDEGGNVVFGKRCFRDQPMIMRRIFEYHEQTSMSLKYEEQSYFESDKDRMKGKSKNEQMIVFTRLYPLSPQLEGQYEYYYPSANVVDGYVFQDGQWTLYEHIDARNAASPGDLKKLDESKMDLFQQPK
jgi:hypothetical protein